MGILYHLTFSACIGQIMPFSNTKCQMPLAFCYFVRGTEHSLLRCAVITTKSSDFCAIPSALHLFAMRMNDPTAISGVSSFSQAVIPCLTEPALACPVLDTGYLIRGNPVKFSGYRLEFIPHWMRGRYEKSAASRGECTRSDSIKQSPLGHFSWGTIVRCFHGLYRLFRPRKKPYRKQAPPRSDTPHPSLPPMISLPLAPKVKKWFAVLLVHSLVDQL
jgi:hypothetical protein